MALGVLCPRGQWQFVGLVGPKGWHTWEKEPVSPSPFLCAPTQRLQPGVKVHEDTEGTWGSRVGWQWGPRGVKGGLGSMGSPWGVLGQ